MTSNSQPLGALKKLRFHCISSLNTGSNCLASQQQSCPKGTLLFFQSLNNECMITSDTNSITLFDLTTLIPCTYSHHWISTLNIFFQNPSLFMLTATTTFLIKLHSRSPMTRSPNSLPQLKVEIASQVTPVKFFTLICLKESSLKLSNC